MEGLHILNGTGTLDSWGVCAIFHKNFSLSSFIPCSSNSSCCSFSICFTLALVRFLISALSLQYFSTSCNTLWNSVGEMSPSCIACEMISVMLPNLLSASRLMALCLPCFTVWSLEIFRVGIVKRERTTSNPPKAAPTGRPTPLANAGIEVPSVIADDVIRPVSTIPMILLNRFFFFALLPASLNFYQEKMPHFRTICSVDMFVVLPVVP